MSERIILHKNHVSPTVMSELEKEASLMGTQRTQKILTLPSHVVGMFDGLVQNRSACISNAVIEGLKNPELLVQALRLRLTTPFEENNTNVTWSRSVAALEAEKKLAEMTRLPGEQVVRLCMEAYIHRLADD